MIFLFYCLLKHTPRCLRKYSQRVAVLIKTIECHLQATLKGRKKANTPDLDAAAKLELGFSVSVWLETIGLESESESSSSEPWYYMEQK